jgi:hypothetical protein
MASYPPVALPIGTPSAQDMLTCNRSKFPSRKLPKKLETSMNIDQLKESVSKLLDQQLRRVKRAITNLREAVPALQKMEKKSCHLENRLVSADSRKVVLKMVEG